SVAVCSRSACPPPMPAPRWRPTASISSTNTIAGALVLACSKRSRTRLAPPPPNNSTKTQPGTENNATPPPGPAGNRAGQQRLTRAGLAEQQHALGDLRAQGLIFRRVLQEVFYLVEFLDRLVGARHIGERRLGHVLGDHLGLGLAEVEDPGATALHLRHE